MSPYNHFMIQREMEKMTRYVYQKKEDVSCRLEGDNKIILYNPDIDDFILINSSALTIWRFLETPHTINEISAHLMESYEESPEKHIVLQNIITFLDTLGEEYIYKVELHEP